MQGDQRAPGALRLVDEGGAVQREMSGPSWGRGSGLRGEKQPPALPSCPDPQEAPRISFSPTQSQACRRVSEGLCGEAVVGGAQSGLGSATS